MAENIGVIFSIKDGFTNKADAIMDKTRDTKRAMENSGRVADTFGSSGQSAFGKIASSAASIAGAIGLTKALGAGMNMVRDGITGAMDRIDTLDQYGRVMEAMTGDTEAAADSIKNIKEMIEGTSMTTDTMASSIQRYVTAGSDIQKAEKWTESWGNANAFYGDGSVESFESVTDALASMNAKGKVDMQQLNRITQAGIPALDIYADKTGKSTAEIQKQLSDGSIGVEEFMDTMTEALDEGSDKFPEVSTAMQDMGQSWSTVFSNIGAYASMGMADVIESIDGFLDDKGLPSMRDMIDSFGEGVYEVFSSAGEYIPIVGEKLVQMYEFAKPGLDWLGATAFPAMTSAIGFAMEKAEGIYGFFSENWPLIGPIVAGVVAGFAAYKAIMMVSNTWTAILAGAQGVLNAVMMLNPAALVVAGFVALVAAGVAVWQNWDTVKEKTLELWESFKETTAFTILEKGFQVATAAVSPLIGFFVSVKEKFDIFKNAISSFKVPEWMSTIGGKISGAAGKARDFVTGSFASGSNKIPHDMIAQVHKGEMIVPARQSEKLRQQGKNIHNIHKSGEAKPDRQPVSSSASGGGDVIIEKFADEIVVREEADIDKIATAFVNKLKGTILNMA